MNATQYTEMAVTAHTWTDSALSTGYELVDDQWKNNYNDNCNTGAGAMTIDCGTDHGYYMEGAWDCDGNASAKQDSPVD